MKLNTKYFNIVETFFIFSSDHNWWLSIYQYIVHSVSGALRTLHWPTLSAPGYAGLETWPQHGGDGGLWWTVYRDLLPHSEWCRLGEINCNARGEVILIQKSNNHSQPAIVTNMAHCPCSAMIIILIFRSDLASWASPSGVILLGGYGSTTTTEKIQEDGTSTYSFNLTYSTT